MYGVHLCIHPSGKPTKRVTIHQQNCSSYKSMSKKGKSKGMYSFNKNAKTLREAIEIASKFCCEWNAPITICKKCFPPHQQISCQF